jgi:hypothetical protein
MEAEAVPILRVADAVQRSPQRAYAPTALQNFEIRGVGNGEGVEVAHFPEPCAQVRILLAPLVSRYFSALAAVTITLDAGKGGHVR